MNTAAFALLFEILACLIILVIHAELLSVFVVFGRLIGIVIHWVLIWRAIVRFVVSALLLVKAALWPFALIGEVSRALIWIITLIRSGIVSHALVRIVSLTLLTLEIALALIRIVALTLVTLTTHSTTEVWVHSHVRICHFTHSTLLRLIWMVKGTRPVS
jgi:hypothetical protein